MTTDVDVTRLAFEIADDDSETTIDCNCVDIRDKRGRRLWMEVDPQCPSSGWWVQRAVKYLELRGKLRRRPGNPNHVKVVR